MQYVEFLEKKAVMTGTQGFKRHSRNPNLFPFQHECIDRIIEMGSAGLFADCGLGKTIMQLEWCDNVSIETGLPTLIFTPLAVAPQTCREADHFGYKCQEAESDESIIDGCKIYVTNYEKAHKFNLSQFGGVCLDESSILANYSGKTKQFLVENCMPVPYKLSCSATPAPNNHLEIGNHSEFLGVMPSNEMIMRWFINDTMGAGNYRLKGHAEKDFWKWVSSWSICITKPSDIGFNDEGYNLPPLEIHKVVVPVSVEDYTGESLIRYVDLSATGIHKELRITSKERCKAVADMVNVDDEFWIVWANTDYDADVLKELIPDAVEVRAGNEKRKRELLDRFTQGKARVIITKPKIGGMGINWQHCHKMAFAGVSYSFKDEYQAIRRSYRFGQKSKVEVYLFMAETEAQVRDSINDKIKQHLRMQEESARHICQFQKIKKELQMVNTNKVRKGENWEMRHGDSCQLIKDVASDSIGMHLHSPPFANLYIYSDSLQDMGNCSDVDEFITHYSFLAKEMHRTLIPGRLAVIHCKDLPRFINRDGAAGLVDFPGDIRALFESVGFVFHSRVTIWKCPVIERERTNNSGLLYGRLVEDSCGGRQGMADYLMVFRKWDINKIGFQPVNAGSNPERFTEYVGMEPPEGTKINPHRPGTQEHRWWSINVWQKYASPVWMDIDQTNVLNFEVARDLKDEKHICPLQMDVIERCVHLWTNPGDIVCSTFAGIGSEGVGSVKLGRKFIGFELKESYFDLACKHLNGIIDPQADMFHSGEDQ
jgi:DNA modification methylase